MKDRRSKGCPNPQCDRNKKKFMYKASDVYCTECGQKLVFVCKKCFGPIEDTGPEHRICPICQAKAEDNRDKAKELGKKAVVGGGVIAGGVVAILKNENLEKVLKHVAK